MYINGKQIIFTNRTVNSINQYLSNIRKSKPLTIKEEYDLWLLKQQGSKSAREQLIFANLRYVISVAKKYLNSKAPFEDLIQAGNEGLIRAVDKFDASLGYHFISFATWYIENEVRKAAYDYIRHDAISLDESVDADDEKGTTRIDFLTAYPCQSTDWNIRYIDTLNDLKAKADKRQYGLGHLTAKLHEMLINGYTTSDFARKYHLSETEMNRLLTILREEANLSLCSAA